jgi:hypothetical protein
MTPDYDINAVLRTVYRLDGIVAYVMKGNKKVYLRDEDLRKYKKDEIIWI